MLILGQKASKIGKLKINGDCSQCNEETPHYVGVYGRYIHAYWIPLFPIGRKATAECIYCYKTIEQKEFSSQMKTNYYEQMMTVQRPKWHWSGLIIVSVAIILFILLVIYAKMQIAG